MNKFFYLSFLILISCDFKMDKKLGETLEKRNIFNANFYHSKPNISTEKIDFVNIIPNAQSYLLGVYKSPTHGTLKTDIAAAFQIPPFYKYTSENPKDNEEIIPTIDDVVLYIPYYFSEAENDSKNRKVYRLDSIYGADITAKKGGLDLEIYELKTILHSTNIQGNTNRYSSNKTYDFDKSILVGKLENHIPKPSDTLIVIKRKTSDLKEYKKDSIKMTNVVPRIAVRLNKQFFKEKILDKMVNNEGTKPEIFKNAENFKRYFRGLYLQTKENKDANFLCSLKMTDAFIDIYYTNSIVEKDTKKVKDKKAKKLTLNFSNLIVNKYQHNHQHLKNDKIYLQGAGGYQAKINLLGYDSEKPNQISQELKKLREKSHRKKNAWMITDANLRLYVDDLSYLDKQNMKLKDTIYKLFMYVKYPEKNENLTDNNTYEYQGRLLKDTNEKAFFYEFKLTDYITELLKKDNDNNIGQFILRVKSSSDDTKKNARIYNRNWNPKTLVIYKGNANDVSDKKALRLKINYTTNKN